MAALALADHTPGAWEATRWFMEATHTGATLRATVMGVGAGKGEGA